ncbi:H-NS histone family protein [Burkholderia sp. MSMB1498]|uniref:H-NS histone family protein n=1 Tax=Burkholderia sp. MSMB1498 TaxID=1637842 RepID=UPI000A6F2EDE
METYKELKAQMDALAEKTEAARVAEFQAVVDDIRAKVAERWPYSFGQVSEIFKWNVRGNHAADLIAGSVAKYASSGVWSARLEWGRFRLYSSM